MASMTTNNGSESAATTFPEFAAVRDRPEHLETEPVPVRRGLSCSTALPIPHLIGKSGNELLGLAINPHVDGRNDLWSKRAWTKAIRPVVSNPIEVLSQRVQQFEKEASGSQKAELKAAEDDFHTMLRQASQKQEAKSAIQKQMPNWKSKIQSGLATFCETAHHYQTIFDVLNNQAPEYTTAIWGAIKLLLIVSVNHEKLKQGVVSNIEKIGDQFALMKVIVDLQPSEQMVKTVTTAYSDFIIFLKKAVKYYTQCRGWRMINTVARPWEARFEPIVGSIKEHVEKIRWLADVGHVLVSTKTQQMTRDLGNGQAIIYQTQRLLGESQWEIYEEQKEAQTQHSDQIRALRERFEVFLEKCGSRLDLLNDKTQTSIVDAQDDTVAVEYLESLEAPTKQLEPQQKSEDFLAHYARPENNIQSFRDEVFPMLYQSMQRSPWLERSQSTSVANLHQRIEVMAWLESAHSELLWIEGFAVIERCEWTTSFASNIESAARPYASITVVSFFCSEQTNSRVFDGPEVVLQSLLFQLIDRHYTKFSWLLCRKYRLTRQRFQDSRTDLEKLFILFHDCLEIAQAPCLYIIFDNVDALWNRSCTGGEGIEKIDLLFDGLRKLFLSNQILCKVLVTSRLPNALTHFSAPQSSDSMGQSLLDQLSHKIVRIPQGARQGVEIFRRPKQILRIPIRRKTALRTIPDPESLLEMQNESGDDEGGPLCESSDEVPMESPTWKDSDDEDSKNELLQHSKDYAKYLDSSDEYSGKSEDDLGHSLELRKVTILAEDDSDVEVDKEDLLPQRSVDFGKMVDEGNEASVEARTVLHSDKQEYEPSAQAGTDSDECDINLD